MLKFDQLWDDDDGLFEKPGAPEQIVAVRSPPRAPVQAKGLASGVSKAAELLERASQREALSASTGAFPLLSLKQETRRSLIEVLPREDKSLGDRGFASAVMDALEDKDLSNRMGRGVFGTQAPRASEIEAQLGPRPPGFSFRAGLRGPLVALPISRRAQGGTFRVQLLRLTPSLKPRGSEEVKEQESVQDRGVGLLEAQLKAGFASPAEVVADLPPRHGYHVLRPLTCVNESSAKVMLEKYVSISKGATNRFAADVFELLEVATPAGDLSDNKVHRLGAWLSRKNARTVDAHLAQVASGTSRSPKIAEVFNADDIESPSSRLNAAYHWLTCNSVRGALRELNKASSRVGRGQYSHFDRLSGVLSACGGTATPGAARRQLAEQLRAWRQQAAHELMGSELWRLYSLLSGELEDAVAGSLDWCTAFGTFLWYRPFEAGPGLELRAAVDEFETAAARYGPQCRFRAAPAYASFEGAGRTATSGRLFADEKMPDVRLEATDLQFAFIRALAGVEELSDLQHYDCGSNTPCPLDVGLSWHFCALLLALLGKGGLKSRSFDLLTQQYCLLLEITGHWEWAIYVARFVGDTRARDFAVHGLLRRNASAGSGRLQLKEQLFDTPERWLFRSQALRSEAAQDWPGAATCWLRGGDAQRAVLVAIGFLVVPVLLGHTATSSGRGSTEVIAITAMQLPARWLLTLIKESLEALERDTGGHFGDSRLEIAAEVSAFMGKWQAAGQVDDCTSEMMTRLCRRCSDARRHILGVPW